MSTFNLWDSLRQKKLKIRGVLYTICRDMHHDAGIALARACNACPRPLQSQECTLVVLSSLRFDYADDDEYECILDPIDANGEEGVYVSIRATDEQKAERNPKGQI